MLTKSKYLLGLQCPKLLWLKCNDPNFPKPDKKTKHLFDVGNKVGQLAKLSFPKGIDIPEKPFDLNLRKTQELINTNKTLFEPSFQINNLFSRADILKPVGKKYDLIEVKSSTKVEEINLHDLSFQKYVYEKAGIKIRKCYLMHINNKYIRKGKLASRKLFIIEDVTKEVNEISKNIEERIKAMLELINKPRPETKISNNCKKPYPCPIKENCWDFLPKDNVFKFYRGGKKSFAMYNDGILELKDTPDTYKLNVKQQIQRKCAKTGEIHIDKQGIKEFLETLEYPLYYLDFETYQIAIPLFNNHKPYQQIPFQYSLHIQQEKGGKLKHVSYLAKGKKDPRKPFLNSLKKKLGSKGSIVVYNQTFEKMILRQLGEAYPEEKEWVESVLDRIIDLADPFSRFYYYNSKQDGRYSLKKVLPAIVGQSYEGMEISDGIKASLEYLYITHEKADPEVVKKVRKDLLEYCKLDTLAEVWILDKLYQF